MRTRRASRASTATQRHGLQSTVYRYDRRSVVSQYSSLPISLLSPVDVGLWPTFKVPSGEEMRLSQIHSAFPANQ